MPPPATEATKKWFKEHNIRYEGKWVFEERYSPPEKVTRETNRSQLFVVKKEEFSPAKGMEFLIGESLIEQSGSGVFVVLNDGIETNQFLGVYAGRVVVDDGEQSVYGMQMQYWGNSFLVDAE